MVLTPLGAIEITVDGVSIDYEARKVSCDNLCKDVTARYSIEVKFAPDGLEHSIACRLKSHVPLSDSYPEPGEHLELMSFFRDNIKLSIGIESESYYVGGKRESDYDYDGEWLDDGVQYCILRSTKTSKYIFGVSWIESDNLESNEIEVQTWYGADPTFFRTL